MKRILNFVVLLALLSSTESCTKKYGYDFENGFEIDNIEDTLGLEVNTDKRFIDRSKYTQARIFPGLMSDKEPRLEDYKVMVDLNYVQVNSSDLRISVAPGNWQSTSMYAPAGELVTIEVPIGIYGLTAQIGVHTTSGSDGIPVPQRDLVITNRQVLFPGKNYLRNLYGGLIYILPSAPLGRQVELIFSGVAKAPSFKLGVTDPVAWVEEIKTSTVPWFELEGNRIVFTMETAKAQRLGVSEPRELMETWDKAIKEGYWDWTGMTEGDPNPKHRAPFNKWRIVHDVLFKEGVAQYAGYPVFARNNDSYFRQASDINGVKNANWGTYHELGHNMQMGSTWSFAGNGEITNNLFSFGVARVFGHQSYKIAEVWHKAVPYIAEPKTKDGTINWTGMFTNGNKYYSDGNDIGLMMYAQIFEKYGYDFMTYIYKRGRDARFTSANDQSKVDFFYEALSEFTQTDMETYLNQWGLFVSTVSKRYISETKGFPLLDRDVWNFNPVTRTGGNTLLLDPGKVIALPKTGWSVTASNHQKDDKYVPEKMIDGDIASFWNSCWNGTCTGDPYTSPAWTVDLTLGASPIVANGMILHQRQAENSNNHIKILNMQISMDGNSWEDLGNRELSRSLSAQYLFFDEVNITQRNVRYVRLTIERANLYNTADYPVIAELGMFTY